MNANRQDLRKLTAVTHLIIDMDGVLYIGDRPLPRLVEFVRFLRDRPIPFVLSTNNSTRTPQQYADKLARMGVEVTPAEILTSAQAAGRFLAQEYGAGARVHVFGEDSLRQALVEAGLVLAEKDVVAVVASMDRSLTYEKIKRANSLIRGGARFIATNLDPTNPTEEGLLPGSGSFVALLRAASGVEPTVVGKPEPIMYRLAMEQMKARPENTGTIGDRLDTDIAGGQRAGLTSICVLSGSTNRAEAEAFKPDYIYEDIAELLDVWRTLPAADPAAGNLGTDTGSKVGLTLYTNGE